MFNLNLADVQTATLFGFSCVAFYWALRRVSKNDWKGAMVSVGLLMICLGFGDANLSSISLGSVKATFDNVEKSKDILNRVQRLSIANATFAHQIVSRIGLWGGISDKERQAILDELDKSTTDLDASPEQRKAMFRPMLATAALNLCEIFEFNVRGALATQSRYDAENEWTKKWNEALPSPFNGTPEKMILEKVFRDHLPAELYGDGHSANWDALVSRLSAAYEDVKSNTRLTQTYFDTLEAYPMGPTAEAVYKRNILKNSP